MAKRLRLSFPIWCVALNREPEWTEGGDNYLRTEAGKKED